MKILYIHSAHVPRTERRSGRTSHPHQLGGVSSNSFYTSRGSLAESGQGRSNEGREPTNMPDLKPSLWEQVGCTDLA